MTTDLNLVFKALADRSRRQLLDRLFEHNGQTLSELCERLSMSRQGVTRHLTLLEDAGHGRHSQEDKQRMRDEAQSPIFIYKGTEKTV